MITKISLYRMLMLLLILLYIAGCASNGKIKPVDRSETDTKLADFLANTEQYTIHYHGNSENIVSGILFDPKNDDKHIQPEGALWVEVSSPETIENVIHHIKWGSCPGYFPQLFEIVGVEGEFFGYLFTGWSYLVVKPGDPNTVRVYGLNGPPEYASMPGGN